MTLGTCRHQSAQQFIIDELSARLGKATSLGVDAIEFDNVDAYQNKTGLTISAATQEQFDSPLRSSGGCRAGPAVKGNRGCITSLGVVGRPAPG